MNNLDNWEYSEEIDIPLGDTDENVDTQSLNQKTNNINLGSLEDWVKSELQKEKEYLKNQTTEFKNNTLLKEKIELSKEIKILNEKNKLLEDRIERLSNNFYSVLQENDELKISKNCYIDKIKAYERELNRYKKKEKNSKKKKYSIIDLIELREKGYSYRKIAAYYKVSPSTIYYNLNKNIK